MPHGRRQGQIQRGGWVSSSPPYDSDLSIKLVLISIKFLLISVLILYVHYLVLSLSPYWIRHWEEGPHSPKLLSMVTYLFREAKLLVRDNIVNDNLAHDISYSTNI